MDKWFYYGYDNEFKEYVVAWHQLHNEVRIHTEDAMMRKMERERKRARKKR